MTPADPDCSIHADLATRAIAAGEELPPQFAACLQCVERLRALRSLRDLGRRLEWTDPDAARTSQVRARILDAAVPSSGRPARRSFQRARPVWSILAVSAAAAIVTLIAIRRGKNDRLRAPSVEVSLGTVSSVGTAQFELVSRAPDEVVRLVEGRIHVEVTHLGPAERFRVVTGDAVVEVRGTAFDVQASDARLREVTVERGRVEVRTGSNPPRVVGEGSHWAVADVAVPAPQGPALAPAPVPAPLVRVAHPARERVRSLENAAPPENPVVTAESPAAHGAPAALPAAELQTGAPVSPALEVKKTPASSPKATAPVPAAATQRSEPETVRREHEEQREERRELREERRLERLEHRR